MKNRLKNIAVMAILMAVASCSSDDNETISGFGNIGIEFDNAFKTNDLVLNSQENTTSLNEVLKISNVKYIISNIVLTNENGTMFTYPKNESYFIVDEADGAEHVLELEDIPAGNYNKVTLGIGVDEAQYNLGEAAQGDFLATAMAAGMISDWADGYKNLWLEGTFTSGTVVTATDFTIQTGKTTGNYNYMEVTLSLPTKALVRTNITPEIHIVADISKVIDGTNKIALSNHISGSSVTISSGTPIDLMVANFAQMFSVAHVHND
jgi:hypothetical protein